MFITMLVIVQFVFTIIMGIYFTRLLKEKTSESNKLKKGDEENYLDFAN